MTVEPQWRHSPLEGWAATFDGLRGVTVREVPFLDQINIRVLADAPARLSVERVLGLELPVAGRSARTAQLEVLWLGPDEWLAVAPADSWPARYEELHSLGAGARVGVVDVSAQRTCLTISGPAATDVLSRGCAVDLHPDVSPPGLCVQTLLARSGVILVVDGASDYRLLVPSSFAGYVASWLCDAALEYQAVAR